MVVWLSKPLGVWHTYRDRGELDPSLTEWEIAMVQQKWLDWYRADWDYGQTTVAFFCAGIGVATVMYMTVVLRDRFRQRALASENEAILGEDYRRAPSVLDRLTAACRYASSRQFRVERLGWYSPPLSAVLAVAGMTIFVLGLILAVRPYYWQNHMMGHSTPIATRSGWIAMGIMPFMIAFATKINFVAMIAGTSHERLQVFHRWSALLMYIAALVHTLPFVYTDVRDGVWKERYNTKLYYWSGFLALAPQTYLVLLSWGPCRNRYYEIFKKMHFLAAAVFMIALFIHTDWILTSWDYFWGTAAAWGLARLLQTLRTLYHSRGLGLSATLETLPDGFLRVRIHKLPPKFNITPGQHVFVRFLGAGLHAFTSHPFTVARPVGGEEGDGERAADIVLRVRGGTTRALAKRAEGKVGVRMKVMMDGPYGGVPVALRTYDRVLLLAGGSGATFTLPILMDLAERMKRGKTRCRRVDFVLAVQHEDSYAWMEDQLATARALAPPGTLNMALHITQQSVEKLLPAQLEHVPTECDSQEKHASPASSADALILCARPDLPHIIRDAARSTRGTLAVAACGPNAFLLEARNAVADCELTIMDGFGQCREIFLQTENFW
ncbi:ferric reductase NAD binding domain-containing protein [Schizophyllum amplum]|uniref:ferric-chelate reductase (NADPH) n=1 Tax=Schizophyllum amplum TaxID=97359 RepID=A0A550CJR6_9AGAR|nr:ferric reductase NAD binding domain-containing protein [Auriculariopsis ampla]